MSNYKRYIELAEICRATYKGPINHHQLSYNGESIRDQKIIHGSFERGFCRLFWNDSTVIISFRGTRERIDWLISNLKLIPVTLRPELSNSRNIKVHQGFQQTLLNYNDKTTNLKSIAALWKHISDYELFNGRKVVIIGHSLGGALATLFAVSLRLKYRDYCNNNLVEIVTFGAPSVGLKKFKRFYNELNVKTIRIVNGSDIVPFTPPFLYQHIGTEIWLYEEKVKKNIGWLARLAYSLRLPIKKFMDDHGMNEYIEKLKTHNDGLKNDRHTIID